MTVVIATGLGPQQLTAALEHERSSIDSTLAMPPYA